MQERARTRGDGIHNFPGSNHRAERSISAGQALRGNQDVGLNAPMIYCEIAASAAHAGHHFVRDQENTVFTANARDSLQIIAARNRGAQRRSADWLKDEGRDLAICAAIARSSSSAYCRAQSSQP